jgi:HAD superfamily hydrolase (TIGR01509 family)
MIGVEQQPLWGALFDWDGVIVDSKALHEAAWDAVAREFGYPHGPDDFRRHFGSQNRRAISEILRWTEDDGEIARISERKEILYRELLPDRFDLLIPGVEAFVAELVQHGVPCAVVSSSPRANIDRVLANAGTRGLGSRLRAIVSAEDTERSKPDPEGFAKGAGRLGLPPARCVVFEDAPVGIAAARAAGMRVVGLTTTHAASELHRADRVIDAFGLGLIEEIGAWFSS